MYSTARPYPRKRHGSNVVRLLVCLVLVLFLVHLISGHGGGNNSTRADSLNDTVSDDEVGVHNTLLRVFLDEENTVLWGYSGGIDGFVEKHLPQKYWGPIMIRDAEGTVDQWGVTNVSCLRLTQLGITETEMQQRYANQRRIREATGCDVLSVPFNPRRDGQCIAFMTNTSNWKELVPIGQSADQRTLKFAILFNPLDLDEDLVIERPIETIIKVPQRLFSSEAIGEVASFHADRVLNVRRVPPTGWVCIPVSMFRDCVEKYKNEVETNAQFLRQSGVKNYEEWVQKDLFDYVTSTQYMEYIPETEEKCIGVSIQLKVADVGHFLSSVLRVPYESHSDTWHDFFDLNANDENVRDFLSQSSLAGVLHLSEINMFDYVIGNMDRSPNKNNFVVGGSHVDVDERETALLHPNHPTFVYLDHGMTFFRKRPRRNAITKSMEYFLKNKTDSFCLFRGPLLRRIYVLSFPTGGIKNETVFSYKMRLRMPKSVYSFIGRGAMQYCAKRMKELLAMAERCLSNERIRSFVLFP